MIVLLVLASTRVGPPPDVVHTISGDEMQQSLDINTALTRRLRILLRLAEARTDAAAAGADPWQFAVPIELLRSTGVTNGDLRWAVLGCYAEVRIETTKANRGRRTFRTAARLDFRAGTCFTITQSGLIACESCLSTLNGHAAAGSRCVPFWDAASGHLLFQGAVIKELHPDAIAQRVVVAAFEAAGWDCGEIPNPLWQRGCSTGGGRRSGNTRHVLGRLNQQRNGKHVHFGMRDKGRILVWRQC